MSGFDQISNFNGFTRKPFFILFIGVLTSVAERVWGWENSLVEGRLERNTR